MSEDGHQVNADLQEDRECLVLFYFCAVFNWSEVDGIICHTFSHLIGNFNINRIRQAASRGLAADVALISLKKFMTYKLTKGNTWKCSGYKVLSS